MEKPILVRYTPSWSIHGTKVFKTIENISLYYAMGLSKSNQKIHLGYFMQCILCGYRKLFSEYTNTEETKHFMQQYDVNDYCKKCLKKCEIIEEN